YYLFAFIGQGIFPILFFAGVILALVVFRNPVSDLWMRVAGIALITIAFTATVHHLQPGSPNGFPEGQGGVIGIGISSFLQPHFNIWGTRLVLALAMLIGLLLAADDLVLRTPGMVGAAVSNVKDRVPQINWNFISIPKLPALPKFVTRDAAAAKSKTLKPAKPKATKPKKAAARDEEEADEVAPAVLRGAKTAAVATPSRTRILEAEEEIEE